MNLRIGPVTLDAGATTDSLEFPNGATRIELVARRYHMFLALGEFGGLALVHAAPVRVALHGPHGSKEARMLRPDQAMFSAARLLARRWMGFKGVRR